MNEEQIRLLNSDFNYKHYGSFYEKYEDKPEGEEENPDGEYADPSRKNNLVGFAGLVSETNMLNKMWQKVELDPDFGDKYEEWLEDEVWTYYD
jgi:hypothetical protein